MSKVTIPFFGFYIAVILSLFVLFMPVSAAFAAGMDQAAFDAKLIPVIRSFSMKDYDTAIGQIRSILSDELDQSQKDKLYTILAECYLYTDNADGVRQVINEFKKSSNKNNSAYAAYLEGRLLFAGKDYRGALAKFRQASAISAKDNNVYSWTAQAALLHTKQQLADTAISPGAKNKAVENYKKIIGDIRTALVANGMNAQAYEIAYISYAQLAIEPEATQNLIDYVTLAPSIDNIRELYQVFYANRDYLSNMAMLDSFAGTEFAGQNEFLYMHGKSMVSYGLSLMDYMLSDIELAVIEGRESKHGTGQYMEWIDEGLSKYNTILKNEKTTSPLYKQILIEEISVYLSIHRMDKAISLVHANSSMEIEYPEIARMFAVVSFYAGEDKKGLEYMDKALSMAVSQKDKASLNYIYDSLSAYYGYRGDYQLARQFSDKALAQNYAEDRLRILYNRFFCLKKLPAGLPEAIKVRDMIISDYAKNDENSAVLGHDDRAMVLLMLADESIEQKQYDKAIEYSMFAQTLSPTVADSYYYTALGFYKKLDYKTALKWVERAEYYESADPQYIYLKSLIHSAMGNKKAAQDDIKKVKTKAPGFINGL